MARLLAPVFLMGCNAVSGVGDLHFEDGSVGSGATSSVGTASGGGGGAAGSSGVGGDGGTGGRRGPCAPAPALDAGGVALDGMTYLTSRALTGQADSTRYVLSLWYRVPSVTSQIDFFTDASLVFESRFLSDGKLDRKNDGTNGDHKFLSTRPVAGVDSLWHHLAISAETTPPGAVHVYVDGASVPGNSQNPPGPLDFTPDGAWGIGARGNGGNAMFGDLAEIYLALDQYVDLSQPACLEAFRTADGHPADLGADGSGPTGSPPTVYLSRRAGEDRTTFHQNRGTGGDFAVVGFLGLSSSTP